MQTTLITGTKYEFESQLSELTEDGWVVSHFQTSWEDAHYVSDQHMRFSAILNKRE